MNIDGFIIPDYFRAKLFSLNPKTNDWEELGVGFPRVADYVNLNLFELS